MAKYQKYAEYKDSGVEWLGRIPSHWVATQVKYGYLVTLGKMLQSAPKSSSDELKKYLKAQNIQPNGISINQVELMWFSPDECKKLLLEKGDVLVSEGGDVGRSAIWNAELEECYIQNAINRVRPKYINDSKYFLYWMAFLKSTDFINIICNKATIAHYTAEKLESSPIFLPPSSAQTQIANFLDHETAKIDTLIAKQEKLIELLKEKRQAVISHAVTKGLNPNVPMKDSGVEWLGEVPEHWTVSRYKYTTERVIVGIAEAATHAYSETGIPIIRSTNIKEDGLMIENVLYIKQSFADANSSKYIYENDIVTVRTGYPGISSVVPKEMNKSHCFTNLVSTPKKAFDANFLNEYLNSELGKSYFDLLGWGSAQKNISVPILQEFPIAFPDYREQVEIIKNIKQQRLSFTHLISKAEQNIQLMQERRTALISAAVTGKIDVRNWQHPNQKNNNTELSA